MPKDFTDCISAGGRVRTKQLSDGRYIRICYPKGGGAGVAGEVHHRAGDRLRKVISGKVD